MVAYLPKSDASEGFNPVIDFLNGSYIKYALIVKANIYVSCIKQFWNTVAIKQVNEVTRLQALVDKNKVVVTKAAIREDDAVALMDDKKDEEAKVVKNDQEDEPAEVQEPQVFAATITVAPTRVVAAPSRRRKGVVIRDPEEESTISSIIHAKTKSKDKGKRIAQGNVGLSKAHMTALDACAALTRRVEHLKYDKVAQALEITKLKRRVKKLKKGYKVILLKLRRLKRVGTSQRIDTFDDTMMDDESNQGRIIDKMDKDDAVALMDDKKDEEAKVVKNDQVVTAASETITAGNAIIYAAEPQVFAATITVAPTRVVAAPSRRRK
nr:hypothetical protein [Tanacetum cinerariifolium]